MIVTEFLLSQLPPHDSSPRVIRNGVSETTSTVESPARQRLISALDFLSNTFVAACAIFLGGSILGHITAYVCLTTVTRYIQK